MSVFLKWGWYKFNLAEGLEFKGAHKSKDGKHVGIFMPDAVCAVTREDIPAHIALVKPDGSNLVALVGDQAVNVRLKADEVLDLEPAVVPDDCPPPRVAHLLAAREAQGPEPAE